MQSTHQVMCETSHHCDPLSPRGGRSRVQVLALKGGHTAWPPDCLAGCVSRLVVCAGVVFNTSTLHDVIVIQALATLDRLIITCQVTDYNNNAASEYPRRKYLATYDVVCIVQGPIGGVSGRLT